MIAGTTTNVTAPTTAPTVSVRTAGTGEIGFTLPGTHFQVGVTAANYFGETVISSLSTFGSGIGRVARKVRLVMVSMFFTTE